MEILLLICLISFVLPSKVMSSGNYNIYKVNTIEEEACVLNCKACNGVHYVKWSRNSSLIQELSSKEEERIHYNSTILWFLPAVLNDSAVYICICSESAGFGSDEILRNNFELTVYKKDVMNEALQFTRKLISPTSQITCPGLLPDVNVTWYKWPKDTTVLNGYKTFEKLPEKGPKLYFHYPNRSNEALYTCIMSGVHHGKPFQLSRTVHAVLTAPSISLTPIIKSPNNETVEVDLGSPKNIVCTVFFGFNSKDVSIVQWKLNGTSLKNHDDYILHEQRSEEENMTIHRLTLTIKKVTEKHFNTYKCCAANSEKWVQSFITLKPRDGKIYDAYITYAAENLQESFKKIVNRFVHEDLINVLEKTYGYKLFISGRDDLPGNDKAEDIGRNLQISRRLLIILTPSDCTNVYDQQVGLFNALLKDSMKVILIEMEGLSSYGELPESLIHIIQKRKPLKWKKKQSANSRFWKHLRYQMP
ncbi:interleukin-1 receptor type 1 isoform X2 [Polypterus senegalus]|uniref:interleukin-1 receptor type 1 isoform X2 n=1 Tax=Polypterus senegalus TaxID=55291 RepID=UPI0019666C4A|nr:interleukin-1 receptor type 1 isoform X2 [Polypterus senegalus]